MNRRAVPRRSLTARLADQADRAMFAARLLLLESSRPHTHTSPKDLYACTVEGQCRAREFLAASVDRIDREGRALLEEYGRRHGR